MGQDDFLNVDGFKEKLATKIRTGIETKLEAASLAELMHATDLRPWSAALRSPSHRIARRPERSKTDDVGLSTLCRPLFAPPAAASQPNASAPHAPHSLGWRCIYCLPDPPADGGPTTDATAAAAAAATDRRATRRGVEL